MPSLSFASSRVGGRGRITLLCRPLQTILRKRNSELLAVINFLDTAFYIAVFCATKRSWLRKVPTSNKRLTISPTLMRYGWKH